MSTENQEKIESTILRVKLSARVNTDKDLAEILGTSRFSFNNMKRRGTILNTIFKWAMKENLDLNWLFYGDIQEDEKPVKVLKERKE